MIFFVKLIFSLNIQKLNIAPKLYTIYSLKKDSVLSYAYMRDNLKSDINNKNNFYFKKEDESELFFYEITFNQNKINENRIHVIESDKKNSMVSFKFRLNSNCILFEKIPKFSKVKTIDNFQEFSVKSIKNYSKFIYDNLLMNQLTKDKTTLIRNILIILNQNLSSLISIFKSYIFLYFNDSLDNISEIFSTLLEKIVLIENFDYNEFKTIFKVYTDNYEENCYMQRYHEIYGQEITSKSKDFFLSCLLTDIANILSFFNGANEYCFSFFNFINCDKKRFGEFYIGFMVPLSIRTIVYDINCNPFIKVYDSNNKEILNYRVLPLNNKMLLLLQKIYLLTNSMTGIKIIIHTRADIFESGLINIENLIYN